MKRAFVAGSSLGDVLIFLSQGQNVGLRGFISVSLCGVRFHGQIVEYLFLISVYTHFKYYSGFFISSQFFIKILSILF